MKKNDCLPLLLTVSSSLLILLGLYLALAGAPDANLKSETGRLAQRIIYFHIATAWVGFLAFFVTFVAGAVYLRTQRRQWDIAALASAEIGTVFMLGVLVSGSIWARPAWGVWWVWDERLTISLVQFLIYVGYLMLRGSVEDPARRARFAAVYGVVAFVSVPVNFVAIRLWRTQHPLVFGVDGGGLSPNMMFAFFFCLIAFSLWYVTLMWHRIRLERLRDQVDELKLRLV
ncbi:MAG TPA: cytochrome c biogenesis protein CcsA [Anaerolineae bacterium]|nr:cytochrome c biogenesis protein CcsA [Anaerolineae bacterium]